MKKYFHLLVLSISLLGLVIFQPVTAQEEMCEEGDIKCFVERIPATDPALVVQEEQDSNALLLIQMFIGAVGAMVSAYAFLYIRRKHSEEDPDNEKKKEDPLKKALSMDP